MYSCLTFECIFKMTKFSINKLTLIFIMRNTQPNIYLRIFMLLLVN